MSSRDLAGAARMEPGLDDPGRLAEIVRQQERYIDGQIGAAQELDDKIEQHLAMAIAIAGGGVALLRYGLRSGADDAAMVGAVLFGMLAAFSSAALLLHAYVGLTRGRAPEVLVGVDPIWLADVADDRTWALAHLQRAAIKNLRACSIENRLQLERSGRLRRMGAYLALTALLSYTIGILMAWVVPWVL